MWDTWSIKLTEWQLQTATLTVVPRKDEQKEENVTERANSACREEGLHLKIKRYNLASKRMHNKENPLATATQSQQKSFV